MDLRRNHSKAPRHDEYWPQKSVPTQIAELLVHAVLLSHGHGLPLSQLDGHPALFPFDVRLNAASLRKSDCMRVQRQGDQSDLVELAPEWIGTVAVIEA